MYVQRNNWNILSNIFFRWIWKINVKIANTYGRKYLNRCHIWFYANRNKPLRHIFAAHSIVCQQTAHQSFTAWFSIKYVFYTLTVSVDWSLERDGHEKCNRCAIRMMKEAVLSRPLHIAAERLWELADWETLYLFQITCIFL